MDNKKIMFLGGALIAYYFWSQQQSGENEPGACQTSIFLVDGQPICDTDLPGMGYVLFINMPTEAQNGWYSISKDFPNAFNLLPATWIESVQKAAIQSEDPNNALYPNSIQFFTQFKAPAATPLTAA